MNREEFLDKNIYEQINYFNEKLRTGISISKISKEIGISKSITEKFKKNSYILKDNQFVNVDLKLSTNNESTQKNTSKPKENKNDQLSQSIIEDKPSIIDTPKLKGRPKKTNNSSNHTISMDTDVWKKLRVYGIMNDKDVSEILEKLTIAFLEENHQ